MQVAGPLIVTSRMVREERARRFARRRLIGFVQYIWGFLNPNIQPEWGWHHYDVADHVEAWLAGEFAGRWFVINLPPGESKSTIFSRCALPWRWLDHPEDRFFCGSHDQDLAMRLNVDRRKVIRSERYQLLRTGWTPDSDGTGGAENATWSMLKGEDNKQRFENTRFGYSAICYPGGHFPIGVHPTHQIYDDIVRPERDKLDPAEWKSAFSFMDGDMGSRTGNRAQLNRMLGMQRLGETDPSGLIFEKYGERVVHLNVRREYARSYPCPCRPTRPEGVCVTQIGSRDPRTEEGELLPGSRMTIELLEDMDAHERATQQNQAGVPQDGKYFRKAGWGYWRSVPREARMIWTLDASGGSTRGRASHSTFYALAEAAGEVYIVDELHLKLDPKQLEKASILWCRRFPGARLKLVEAKALGPAVVATLKRLRVSGIREVNPDRAGNKTARALSWYRFQGQFLLPARDAARPTKLMAPAKDPKVLAALPFVPELAAVRKKIESSRYRDALADLIRIDEFALSGLAREVYDAAVAVAVPGWEPMGKDTQESFKADMAAVPAGARWDRADSLWLGADHYRPRLARRHGRMDREEESPADERLRHR